MTHAYHPHCGCAACDRDEEAAERREEYIDDYAPIVAARLIYDYDVAESALCELSDDVLAGFANDLAEFFTRYHNATGVTDESAAGHPLYRAIKPYVEAAALAKAREDVATDYDKRNSA